MRLELSQLSQLRRHIWGLLKSSEFSSRALRLVDTTRVKETTKKGYFAKNPDSHLVLAS